MKQCVAEAVRHIYEGGEDFFRFLDEVSASEPQHISRVVRGENANNLSRSNAGIIDKKIVRHSALSDRNEVSSSRTLRSCAGCVSVSRFLVFVALIRSVTRPFVGWSRRTRKVRFILHT